MRMKAQISSEFLVVFSMLMMVFLVMFTIFFGSNQDLARTQDSLRAQRDATALASAMNFVYLAGDGSSYDLPMGILDDNESITVSNSSVYSVVSGSFGSAPLVSGRAIQAGNMSGSVNITNSAGVVHADS
jgi:uncharacterized protein (UPF0333 family)